MSVAGGLQLLLEAGVASVVLGEDRFSFTSAGGLWISAEGGVAGDSWASRF